MSLTRNTRDWPESWDDAFLYAFEHDVVVVAAAGNRGSGTTEVGAPATIPGVLTVAGVDRDKNASFDASARRASRSPSPRRARTSSACCPTASYVQWSGTSGAAPIVAGTRRARPRGVPRARRRERHQPPHPHGRSARAGTVPSPLYGCGHHRCRVAALTADVPTVDASPMGSLADWIRLHRRADAPTPETGTRRPGDRADRRPAAAAFRRCADRSCRPRGRSPISTVPLSLVAGFGTLAALLGIGATRHTRRTVRTREQ